MIPTIGNSMITHVAIKCSSGRVFSLPKPNRHYDVIHAMNKLLGKENALKILGDHTQGFLQDSDIFLNRRQAFQHAAECKQIQKELFSEDLW